MNKDEVVATLREIADLLEITNADQFEFAAYRKAADALTEWSGNLASAVAEQKLVDIPAVGKKTAKVIGDLVQTETSPELERVRGLVPKELPKLLRFRGLGPKRVRTLWKELEIESPDDLEQAIDEGRVAKLKGFGAKTIESMKASIEYFRTGTPTVPPKPRNSPENIPQAIASTGAIFAGTSGYSYPKWKGSFFPDDAKSTNFLRHYANQLKTVEINNTFYRFPSEKVVDQWKTQTSVGFQFALKAHRRVTHQMRLSESTIVRIQEFVARCSVLESRLGCILFQLPPDFARDDERLGYLLQAIPPGPRYAVEFRHVSWLVDEVLGRLQEKNVACVSGDSETQEPQHFATADFVYVRLRKPSYTKVELDTWQGWFNKQQAAKRDVLVYLKHDETGDAPTTVKRRWNS